MEDFAPYRAWVDGHCRGPVPEGESMEAFCARTCAAFGALMDQAAASGGKHLAVVAHGGTQMAVLERYGRPHRDFYAWPARNGGGYVLDASRWEQERTLTVLRTVQYKKGGSV